VHAAPEIKPKDAKPLDLHKSKDLHTPPVVTPKKDTPPPVKKDTPPPVKKDTPPAKKDPPPPPSTPKKDKDKEKDKDKDKKKAASSMPPLHQESAKAVARTDIKTATPVRQEIMTRAPARQEVRAAAPVPQAKPAQTSRPELHASAHTSAGHGSKGQEKH
jgi:hypothetical protein